MAILKPERRLLMKFPREEKRQRSSCGNMRFENTESDPPCGRRSDVLYSISIDRTPDLSRHPERTSCGSGPWGRNRHVLLVPQRVVRRGRHQPTTPRRVEIPRWLLVASRHRAVAGSSSSGSVSAHPRSSFIENGSIAKASPLPETVRVRRSRIRISEGKENLWRNRTNEFSIN